MKAMEDLTEEISRKEKFIRQETEKLELLAAKLSRKEKTLNQEKLRLKNLEADVKSNQDELVKQQTFITAERETLDKERTKLASTRSLSSMYIPDLKQVLQKK